MWRYNHYKHAMLPEVLCGLATDSRLSCYYVYLSKEKHVSIQCLHAM